jgi:hypothetical protein
MGIYGLYIPERQSEHEVQINFEVAGQSLEALIA